MTRAKEVLDIEHTDVLAKFFHEAVDGHCCTIGFWDSFSRFSKVYFMKTRDEEVMDKVKQFALLLKTRHFSFWWRCRLHLNEIKRYCRNQRIRFENFASIFPQKMGKIGKILGTSVVSWLALSWLTPAWTKIIGHILWIWFFTSKTLFCIQFLRKHLLKWGTVNNLIHFLSNVLFVWHLCLLKNNFAKS